MKKVTILPLFLPLLFPLVIYLFSSSVYPMGYADADELATAAYTAGYAHPSGYLLLTTLLRIWQLFLSSTNPAHASNLFSAVVTGFSLILLFLILKASNSAISLSKFQYRLAIVGVLITAFSSHIWLYAGIIEVVSLTHVIALANVLTAILWYQSNKKNTFRNVWFVVTVCLAGLGLAHVHSYIFLYPPLLFLYLRGIRGIHRQPSVSIYLLAITGWIASILIQYLPLISIAMNNHPFSWYFEPSLEGLFHFATRQDYAGFFVENSLNRPAYPGLNVAQIFTSLPKYVSIILSHTSPLVWIAFIAAMYRYFKKPSTIKIFFLLLFFFTGPVFAGIMGLDHTPPDDRSFHLLEGISNRQLILSEYFFHLIAVQGIIMIAARLRPSLQGLFIFITVIALGLQISFNAPIGIHTFNNVIDTYSKQLLDAAKPNSVIICSGDTACYGILYQSLVNQMRPDVTVLSKSSHYRRGYLINNQDMYGLPFFDPPDFYPNLIAWHIHKGSTVYLTHPNPFYDPYIGTALDPFFLIPSQGLLEVATTPIPSHRSDDVHKALIALSHSQVKANSFGYGLEELMASHYYVQAYQLALMDQEVPAKLFFEAALSLSHQPNYIFQNMATYYRGNFPVVSQSSESVSAREFEQSALQELDLQQYEQAYHSARKATLVDPLAANARILTSYAASFGNSLDVSQLHLETLLKFHHNPLAEQVLLSIQNNQPLPTELERWGFNYN